MGWWPSTFALLHLWTTRISSWMQNRRDGEGKNPIIGPTLISEVIGLKKNSFLTTIFFAYVGPHTSAKLEQFSQ